MIHARADYDRIQDPALEDRNLLPTGTSTPVGQDEPVFLLRAQDKLMLPMLEHYHSLLLHTNAKDDMYDSISKHILRVRKWQEEHGSKTPDLP